MNSKRLLGCDVDLCLVSTDKGWRDYLGQKYGYVKTPMLNYNFGEYYPGKDAYEYWRNLDYSQFKPIEGSVEALEKLSKCLRIVFISSIKGNHTKSKYYWLKEHFPFMEGYIATKEKYLMNNSVVAHIDDRKSMLKGFDFEKRILFNTPYEQEVECETALSFDRWNDEIVKKICEEYL